MQSTPSRILVTGMGAVTPVGLSVSETWTALLSGRDGITPLDIFDPGDISCVRAGQIRGFSNSKNLLAAGARDRATGFAGAACLEALRQAGVAQGDAASCPGIGLVTATNFGAMDHGEATWFPSDASADASTCGDLTAGAAAEKLAAALKLQGPRTTITLSCAAGAAGLAYAAGLIRHRRADRILVVGYDALSRFAWSGLCALRTMARDCVRPFDVNRSGTIFSEGAAAILLESESACQTRGGTPLAELAGWGTNNNGYHLTAPAPRGAGSSHAMRQALTCAGLTPDQVDHINAHGTGTKPNDSTEAQAIADVFGARAPSIPVTAIKSSLGHMLGAAGAIEAIASILSLRAGLIPPTMHVETLDPECPVDLVVNKPREIELRCVLSNSAGIGGCNAAVIFTRA